MSVNLAIEQLRRLCRLGFNGERLFRHDGDLDLVHYTRELQGLREVVLVYHEGEALPRVPGHPVRLPPNTPPP